MKAKTETKSSYQKGIELEAEFAKFMKEELKYDGVKTRKQIPGKYNIKGSEADIIGVTHDPRKERFRKASIVAIVIALLGFILILTGDLSEDWFTACLIIEVAGMIYVAINRRLGDKFTWVECKNWKTNIPIKEVSELYRKVQDNNASKDRRFKIDKLLFVANKGFVNVAEDFAREHNIACYVRQDNSFVELKQWE